MAVNTLSSAPRAVPMDGVVAETANVSAVSWGAVLAGALGAVAASVILIELGIGLGFSSISVWPNSGASLATLGVMAGIWLILVQWIASGMGGYLAGRLRTRWVGLHTDEVFFRDTVHGFLAWSLGTVIGVLLIAAGSSMVINAGSRVAGGAAAGASQGAAVAGGGAATNPAVQPGQPINDGYYVDMLFRPAPTNAAGAPPNAAAADQSTASAPPPVATAGTRNAGEDRAIAVRIFARDLPSGTLAPDDRSYLAQTIAARTGMTEAQAEKRVDDTVAQVKAAEDQARQAAEKARKAAAFGSIATALAMLVGAFIASVAGAMGGRLREEY
jgi:hypothetical protein